MATFENCNSPSILTLVRVKPATKYMLGRRWGETLTKNPGLNVRQIQI